MARKIWVTPQDFLHRKAKFLEQSPLLAGQGKILSKGLIWEAEGLGYWHSSTTDSSDVTSD